MTGGYSDERPLDMASGRSARGPRAAAARGRLSLSARPSVRVERGGRRARRRRARGVSPPGRELGLHRRAAPHDADQRGGDARLPARRLPGRVRDDPRGAGVAPRAHGIRAAAAVDQHPGADVRVDGAAPGERGAEQRPALAARDRRAPATHVQRDRCGHRHGPGAAAVRLAAEHRSAAVPRRPEHGGGAVAALLLADAAAEHAGHGHRGAARLCPGARFLHHARSPRWLARDHAGDGDRDAGRRPAGLEPGLGCGHGAAGADRGPGGRLRPPGRAGPGVGLMGERTSPLVWVVTGLVMAFLAAPSLLVIAMSFSGGRFLEFPPRTLSVRWYEAYWSSAAWWNATVRSLQIGVMVTVLATTLGTL